MTFTEFNLDSRLLKGIDRAGFTTPTPIQSKAIPAVLSGRDLIGWLRAEHPTMPVLVVSGYTDGSDVRALADVPMLRKPFTPRALLAAVQDVLG